MRLLRASEYRRMPWRNGGGVTTEIVIEPEDRALAGNRFLYRVSIADVASDGPFSRFDGYERHIMLLEGAGMTIDCGEHGRLELARPFEPHVFSGDWDVRGSLTAGPVRDFNLIADRAGASASLVSRVVSEAEGIAVSQDETCIVHVISGELDRAATGDTLVARASFEIVPRGEARIAIARVQAIV